MGRGRRPDAELAEIRTRVELLMHQGLRSPAIQRALSGAENPAPVAVSERQVRNHMKAVRRAWLADSMSRTIDEARAAAIAGIEDMKRVALQRSALNTHTNAGVGYLNLALRAADQLAKIAGLYAPLRTELSGPAGQPLELLVSDHPADHLGPAELATRWRQLALDAEAEAAEEPADS